jgi:hypothetical protein
MNNSIKAFAVALGILGAASIAAAHGTSETAPSAPVPGMMQDQGMMGMMGMMQQMGPMMERCDEMMAAMSDHMTTAPQAPAPQNGKDAQR